MGVGEDAERAHLVIPGCGKCLRGQDEGKTNLVWVMVSNRHGREGVGDGSCCVMVTRKYRERMGVDGGKEREGKLWSRCIV